MEQMQTTKSRHSLTVMKTDVERDGRHLVLACGYSTSGKFGYFICWEHLDDGWHVYSNVRQFFQKRNEKTLNEALHSLEMDVVGFKTHN